MDIYATFADFPFLPPGCRPKFEELTARWRDYFGARKASQASCGVQIDAINSREVARINNINRGGDGGFPDIRSPEERIGLVRKEADRERRQAIERNRTNEDRLDLEGAPITGAFQWLADAKYEWTRAGRPTGWFRQASVEPTLPSGASSRDGGITTCRKQIAELTARYDAVMRAPETADELKQQIDASIEGAISQGRVSINAIRRDGDPARLASYVSHIGGQAPNVSAMFGLLVWGMRDQLREKLHALVDATDLTGAMTDTSRAKELGRIARERLTLERLEEALICAAELDGVSIARRPDADPRAILEIEETE